MMYLHHRHTVSIPANTVYVPTCMFHATPNTHTHTHTQHARTLHSLLRIVHTHTHTHSHPLTPTHTTFFCVYVGVPDRLIDELVAPVCCTFTLTQSLFLNAQSPRLGAGGTTRSPRYTHTHTHLLVLALQRIFTRRHAPSGKGAGTRVDQKFGFARNWSLENHGLLCKTVLK